MSGTKGHSGIRRTFKGSIFQFIDRDVRNIPVYLAEMSSQALKKQRVKVKCPSCSHEHTIDAPGGGNLEALQWLLDRHFGKAPQSLQIKQEVTVTGDSLASLALAMAARDSLLLAGHKAGSTLALGGGSPSPNGKGSNGDVIEGDFTEVLTERLKTA
jgi:hypothetical protein